MDVGLHSKGDGMSQNEDAQEYKVPVHVMLTCAGSLTWSPDRRLVT